MPLVDEGEQVELFLLVYLVVSTRAFPGALHRLRKKGST